MRVSSLKIENFRGIRDGFVRFNKHAVLIGDNNREIRDGFRDSHRTGGATGSAIRHPVTPSPATAPLRRPAASLAALTDAAASLEACGGGAGDSPAPSAAPPSAASDREVAKAVAEHKSYFFVEKDAAGGVIDYFPTVAGGLQIVPEGAARDALAADYANMLTDEVMVGDALPFDQLMKACAEVAARANATAGR